MNNQTIMLMMVGIPGSGKSYLSNKLSDAFQMVVHSSDDLREELFGDVNINGKETNDELFEELHKRIRADLRVGKSVIYDATNIYPMFRKDFLASLSNIECLKLSVYIMTPKYQCVKNNKRRNRKVPEDIIDSMAHKILAPDISEGFDEVIMIKNYNYDEVFRRVMKWTLQ